jgi:hypothetical protein
LIKLNASREIEDNESRSRSIDFRVSFFFPHFRIKFKINKQPTNARMRFFVIIYIRKKVCLNSRWNHWIIYKDLNKEWIGYKSIQNIFVKIEAKISHKALLILKAKKKKFQLELKEIIILITFRCSRLSPSSKYFIFLGHFRNEFSATKQTHPHTAYRETNLSVAI